MTLEAVIQDRLGVCEVSDELRFAEDLKIDSLDFLDLLLEVEQQFGVEIPDDDMLGMHTVGDLRTWLERPR